MANQPTNDLRTPGSKVQRAIVDATQPNRRMLVAPTRRKIVEIALSSAADTDQAGGLIIPSTSCAANATTNINLMLAANAWVVIVYYSARRTADSEWEWGELRIGLNLSHASPEIAAQRHRPAAQALGAIGISFTADVSGGVLRLNVAVDNSSVNAVTFKGYYTYIAT